MGSRASRYLVATLLTCLGAVGLDRYRLFLWRAWAGSQCIEVAVIAMLLFLTSGSVLWLYVWPNIQLAIPTGALETSTEMVENADV